MLALHESMVVRSGVLVSEDSDQARWIGVVFGVGPGARGSGLAFGDLVEVSRWHVAVEHGRWSNPQRVMRGAYTGAQCLLIDAEDRGRALEADPRAHWVFLTPEQIICRICGADEAPGHYPTADRILVRHRALPERAGGVELAHLNRKRNPVGQIVALGPGVDRDDYHAGDWVLVDPRAHCTELKGESETYTLVSTRARRWFEGERRERECGDVLASFGAQEPGEAEAEWMAKQ